MREGRREVGKEGRKGGREEGKEEIGEEREVGGLQEGWEGCRQGARGCKRKGGEEGRRGREERKGGEKGRRGREERKRGVVQVT